MCLWTVPSSLLLKVDEINLGVHTEGTARRELGLGVCDEVGWAGSLAHSHTGGGGGGAGEASSPPWRDGGT